MLMLCVFVVLMQPPQGHLSKQAPLTEASLQRHNETESAAHRPSFSGKPITVNNRSDKQICMFYKKRFKHEALFLLIMALLAYHGEMRYHKAQ